MSVEKEERLREAEKEIDRERERERERGREESMQKQSSQLVAGNRRKRSPIHM